MNFIDIRAQYRRIESEVDAAVKQVLEHGQHILGPEVAEFEAASARFLDISHALGVANGTDALVLALRALDIGPGDAVFVPAYTFFATAEAVSVTGATPIFVDVDPNTYNIDPVDLQRAINSLADQSGLRSSAAIAVDLFGWPADYPALQRICQDSDLRLIEDAAQAFGGAFKGKKLGTFGDIATTSFFPAKPLGCYGDGGAVFTDSTELAEAVRSLRVHGQGEDKYNNVRIGYNSRLDSMQAAILLEKLKILEEERSRRQALADRYARNLEGRIGLPPQDGQSECAWAQYTLRVNQEVRGRILDALRNEQIPSVVYYHKPLHLQPAYEHLGYSTGDLPVSESLSACLFSVPVHPYLNDEDVDRVCEVILDELDRP